jgi:ornithine carbamoyltransferase
VTRHFLTIAETSDEDLARIYRLAVSPLDDRLLAGQGVALIFEHPSLRTRAASSTAVHELGGFATFFSDEEIGLDRRESVEDVGRTLAEMYALCCARVRRHDSLERLREAVGDRMSVVNLLSDTAHPTQAIADVLTLADEFADGDVFGLAGRHVAYVGDATNVTRSLAVALVRLGVHVRVGAPAGYQLQSGGGEDPQSLDGPGSLVLTDDPYDAVRDADAIYTDAWVSMGLEEEAVRRRADLAGFTVTPDLLRVAQTHAVVLHCLPAHRGEEILDEVLDSAASRVWRQVYHRRSAMVGVLRWIKGEK